MELFYVSTAHTTNQNEIEQVCVVVAQEEPQAPLPGSVTHPPSPDVRPSVQGAASEVQRALDAHPS